MRIKSTYSQALWRNTICTVLCIVIVGNIPPPFAHGQAAQTQQRGVPSAIAALQSGDFDLGDVEVLAKAKAVEAIPVLKEQFRRTQENDKKAKIAEALVKLGDRDNTYWDFLLNEATAAVDSDPPDLLYDSHGVMRAEASPDLIAWAASHHISIAEAAQEVTLDLPGNVLLLGETGDARGIPLLRRALSSRDSSVAISAAKGLAEIQDKDSTPWIIAAFRKAPRGWAPLLAESLLYFDDPAAQSAFDAYVPKERAKALREAKARGHTPFG